MLRHLWPTLPLILLPLLSFAVDTRESHPRSLEHREHHLSTNLTRASEFVDVPHISAAPACEEVHPPQALTTPDPMTTELARGIQNAQCARIRGCSYKNSLAARIVLKKLCEGHAAGIS